MPLHSDEFFDAFAKLHSPQSHVQNPSAKQLTQQPIPDDPTSPSVLARRVTELEDEVARLKSQGERLELRHSNEMAGVTARADRSDQTFRLMREEHARLAVDYNFVSSILEASSDCIKVLSLDGTLEFMSAGGQRVMEVEDVTSIVGCPWPDFWPGDGGDAARSAVALARSGETASFEGPAPTAKGTARWWEVTVSPILDGNRKPAKLLSISRDITVRKAVESERQMLVTEMQHRIMNLIAVVSAVIRQSMRNAPTMEAAEEAIANRLHAMSRAHKLLVPGTMGKSTVKDVVLNSIETYDDVSSRFNIRGDDIEIGSRGGLALALALNELCTNAIKYGALSNDKGHVDIEWSADRANKGFTLVWAESGGPPVTAPTKKSFGSRLIVEGFQAQLGGKTTMDFSPTGLVCRFEAELEVLDLSAGPELTPGGRPA